MKKKIAYLYVFIALGIFGLTFAEKVMNYIIGSSSANDHVLEGLLVSIFLLLLGVFHKIKD